MLFWLFVIALIIGVICIVIGNWIFDNTTHDTDWLNGTGWVISVLATIAILISGFIMIDSYSCAEANVAVNTKKYEALVYQMENNLYNNDNDLGKKELYNEVREWNEDLAYYQKMQNNFWFGIFYPNVYDQFEFISYTQ